MAFNIHAFEFLVLFIYLFYTFGLFSLVATSFVSSRLQPVLPLLEVLLDDLLTTTL